MLASVGCGGCGAPSLLLRPHLAFQANRGCGDLGFFQLTRSNSSPGEVSNLGGYISAHTKTRIQQFSHSFSISVFWSKVGACRFRWAVLYRIRLFYASLSHQKVLAMNKQLFINILCPTLSAVQRPNATKVRSTSAGRAKWSKVKLPCHCSVALSSITPTEGYPS